MKREEAQLLALLRSGLWKIEPPTELFSEDTDWDRLYELADEQTVVGIVGDGIANMPAAIKPKPRVIASFLADFMRIEDVNRRMDLFLPKLLYQLEKRGCHPLLLKGQSMGICYPDASHRESGDIDLLITDEKEYNTAREFMLLAGKEAEDEDASRKHSAFTCRGIPVEIHGDFKMDINRQCEKHINKWKAKYLLDKNISIRIADRDVAVPDETFNAVFVLGHVLNHFMGGGIGLRQVNDWMMFLKAHHSALNQKALLEDLQQLGMLKYWKIFGAMIVNCLGCPKEYVPFYDSSYKELGDKVLSNIFFTGNFGALQKRKQLDNSHNKIIKKMVTFFGQTPVYWRNFKLFPLDTLYCYRKFITSAIKAI